ncbi:MAG: metallophosphoesterase [Promethearchaeota archaeon]
MRSFIGFIILSSFTFAISFSTLPPFPYKYNDGPYLIWNDDPKTTITIIWMTKQPEFGELKYGKYGGPPHHENIARDIEYNTIHVIKLTNLKPGTKYFYEIPSLGNKIHTFKTAPEGKKSFNFMLIGDLRQVVGERSVYDELVELMNDHDYNFIISPGDNVQGGSRSRSWHQFLQIMTEQGRNHPYMTSIGNHDTTSKEKSLDFKEFFPYDYASSLDYYYSFDYSNAHFIVLDTFDLLKSDSNYISDEQIRWLCEELDNNRDKWLFVIVYKPPYSTAYYNMNDDLISQLCPIFYEYEVDVVISGHEHTYESFWTNRTEDWGGILYLISGGGGAPIHWEILQRPENPWKNIWHNASIEPYQNDYITLHDQLYGELVYHFIYFEVNNNILHIQAIRSDGSIIHEFYYKK